MGTSDEDREVSLYFCPNTLVVRQRFAITSNYDYEWKCAAIMSKIRVLLADDHTLFRQGIGSLLSRDGDIEVVVRCPIVVMP